MEEKNNPTSTEVTARQRNILWFREVGVADVALVGGKNSSLGEMYNNLTSKGVNVPNGFATTSGAYFYFLEKTGLTQQIQEILKDVDVHDLRALQQKGKRVRNLILAAELPEDLKKDIVAAYQELSKSYNTEATDVAVRSSATAEDLPSISEKEHVLIKINGSPMFDEIGKIYEKIGSGENVSIEIPGMKNNKVEWLQVKNLFRHRAENETLYKLRTICGREIIISPNHSLIILDEDTLSPRVVNISTINGKAKLPVTAFIPELGSNNNGKMNFSEYVQGDDVAQENGFLMIKNKSGNWKIQNGLPKEIEISDEFTYFMGLYLAEGSTYKHSISITNYNDKILHKIANFWQELGIYRNFTVNRYSIRAYCPALVRFLHETTGGPLVGIRGKGKLCATKRVPNFVFGWDKKGIGTFLRGCFDGDGTIHKSDISYCTISEMLASGIVKLLEIMDIGVTIRRKKNAFNVAIQVSDIKKFAELIGFEDETKSKKLSQALEEYDKKSKHPEFKYGMNISGKLSDIFLESIWAKFEKKSVQISVCKICNQKTEQTSYHNDKKRYFCKACQRTFYENEVTFSKEKKYVYFDRLGRFTKGMFPWNYGRMSGRHSLNELLKKAREYKLENVISILTGTVKWDELKEIIPVKYNGWVYDFEVPGAQNFAAGMGGIITHNSASFAGQQETFLNITGPENVLEAVKKCYASLFTDRAIVYRQEMGFGHTKVGLSAGVQKMVRSDMGASGVMFSCDTESGFGDVVLINASLGLGENVVLGRVEPDQYYVFETTLKKGFRPIIEKKVGSKLVKMVYTKNPKTPTKNIATTPKERHSFVLTDDEILQLAKWSMQIEEHYKKPMDMEWARDGKENKLYIVQARPETVQSKKNLSVLEEYKLELSIPNSQLPKVLAKGMSVGSKIGSGKAHKILSAKQINEFKKGEVLVTGMTDPDWVPAMKLASAIVTDQGGRTAHAAIVSRELGIPCIVGTGNATKLIKTGQDVTIDCSNGEHGVVYQGLIPFKVHTTDISHLPKTRTKISMNLADPSQAFNLSFIPNDGVGLCREEFIIANTIKIHPLALINYKKLPANLKKQIDVLTPGYENKVEFYVDKLAEGIGKIGAAFYPKQVIVRFSDFKTNEYRGLIGGELYEPKEENPMIGFRGASRYYNDKFKEAFILECHAIKKVREEFGIDNVQVMIPVCRTIEEGRKVLELMKEAGLSRNTGQMSNVNSQLSLKVYAMCEVPANVILAKEFLEIFDGFSIGSNDLTQLTLGLDRDNSEIASVANEKNEAVKISITKAIQACREAGKYSGICGQAPSDFPDFAEFLVEQGIESISLNPDSIIKTTIVVAEKEKNIKNT